MATESLVWKDNFSVNSSLSHHVNTTLVQVPAYVGIALTALAIMVNFAVLLTFSLYPRHLITPFTIHVVNMAIINFINAAVYQPLHLAVTLNRDLFRGNQPFCSTLKYLQWTTIGMTAFQQCVICIDRWLALLRPLWYRQKTIRFGLFATLVAFTYHQMWYLPLFIADVAIITVGPRDFCYMTKAWPVYESVARIAGLLLPEVILTITYPFLLYLVYKQRRVRPGRSLSPMGRQVSHQPNHNDRIRSELHLALWLVMLQIAVWTPAAAATILYGARSRIPHLLEFMDVTLIAVILLQVMEPMVYLVFLRDLRHRLVSVLSTVFFV